MVVTNPVAITIVVSIAFVALFAINNKAATKLATNLFKNLGLFL